MTYHNRSSVNRKRINFFVDPPEQSSSINNHHYHHQSIDSSIWSSSSSNYYHPHSHHQQKCTKIFIANNENRCQFNRCLPESSRSLSMISSSYRWPIFICLSLIMMIIDANPQQSSSSDHWRSSSSSTTATRSISPHYHLQHYIHHTNLNYSSPSTINRQQPEQHRSNRMIKPQIHHNHHSNYHQTNTQQQQQQQNAIKSPYYNSQLLSIPFPLQQQQQLLYQNTNLQNYFSHHNNHQPSSTTTNNNIVQRSSSSSPQSLLRRNSIISNQIPRSINPMMIETNMIAASMKGAGVGGKWWDIARQPSPSSTMIESSSFDVTKQQQQQHMDGRHTNLILPSSSSGGGTNSIQQTNQLLTSMNLPLRKKQRKLVRDNPGILIAITRAMKMAINECQLQFKDRRWNCPVNDWKKGKHVFGKIIQRGCRETAFVYALTSAAVAHSIARACSEGMIETCTCDYRYNRKPSGMDWEWGGCSDNIDFGYKFARQFVDSAERGRDLRFVMNLHNNEAGRLHVSNEMRRECKCHGMSGSCTLQTCWMRLPSFHDIGNNLKDRFDGASRVSISNEYRGFTRKMMKHVQLKPYEMGYKTPTREDLIYFEESPDFCIPNHKYGIMGTQGRQCNASSIGVEGCHLLCCGRGYETEEIEEYERCNCTFHWCCQVNCKICKIKKKIYRCS